MTNGDKIRQMTNEELATILRCFYCIHFKEKNCNVYNCYEGKLEWLNQDAEEGEENEDL